MPSLLRSLTILVLLCASRLESQIALYAYKPDELWKKGLDASKFATDSPKCAANDWVYVETLLYFFAWYQTSRPTDPNEAAEFARDFNNKTRWASSCLKLSRNSSHNLREDNPTARRAPVATDTSSFSSTPPRSTTAPQADDQGRTIPQLVQLLAEREGDIRARDEALATQQRNLRQEISAVHANYNRVVRSFVNERALRAAGEDEEGYRCTIESKASGRVLALTREQGLHTRPKGGQAPDFGIIRILGGGRGRFIMYAATQEFLTAQENSSQVSAVANGQGDRAAMEFVISRSGEGVFGIAHVKTNRWLRDDGGILTLGAPTATPNDVATQFILGC
ncbi:MAG: hypothetical protein AB1762_00350 [Gemmatimonadota bacterium]